MDSILFNCDSVLVISCWHFLLILMVHAIIYIHTFSFVLFFCADNLHLNTTEISIDVIQNIIPQGPRY